MVYRRNQSRPGDKWILLFCFICIFVFFYLCEKTGSYIKLAHCEKKCMKQMNCLEKCHRKYKIEKYLSK